MKVLQVECIVPGLFDVRAPKLSLAALELEREDRRPCDHDGVDSAAEPWNIELEVDGAGEPGERRAEKTDLIFPRVPLFGVNVVASRR
jgi:hypothetical protein